MLPGMSEFYCGKEVFEIGLSTINTAVLCHGFREYGLAHGLH